MTFWYTIGWFHPDRAGGGEPTKALGVEDNRTAAAPSVIGAHIGKVSAQRQPASYV